MDEEAFQSIPLYVDTPSTIKIAGGTLPKGAGKCAFHYLLRRNFPIDFMCIGANANQQATKAMGVFRYMVEHDPSMSNIGVAFQPFHYKTVTHDTTGDREKSVTVWRTLIFEKIAENKEIKTDAPTPLQTD